MVAKLTTLAFLMRQQEKRLFGLYKSRNKCNSYLMSTQTAFSEFRKNRDDLTLDAVAGLFNVDRTTILRWEKGEPPVPIKRIAEIEAITGIRREELRPDIYAPALASRPALMAGSGQ